MSKGYYHLIWICPFYKKNERNFLACDPGRVDFKDKEQAYQYFGRYCASFRWQECSLAQSLTDYIERNENEETNQETKKRFNSKAQYGETKL